MVQGNPEKNQLISYVEGEEKICDIRIVDESCMRKSFLENQLIQWLLTDVFRWMMNFILWTSTNMMFISKYKF
jgi:hypothetical protein